MRRTLLRSITRPLTLNASLVCRRHAALRGYLAEADVLLGPEVVVPVLGLLPQVSQTSLQLRLVLGDVVNDGPNVGERVRWTDPVVCGAGRWSEGRSLHRENS